jgi:hypothetical protein
VIDVPIRNSQEYDTPVPFVELNYEVLNSIDLEVIKQNKVFE